MLKVIERIIYDGSIGPTYIKIDLAQVPDAKSVEVYNREGGVDARYTVGESLEVIHPVKGKEERTIRVDGQMVDTFNFPQPGQCSITLVVANVLPQAHIPLQPQPGRDRVQLIINGITVYTN